MNFIIDNNIITECIEKNLYSCTIPEGIVAIADKAFMNCKNLMNVSIPPTVKKVGDSAFENCPKLVKVDLSNVSFIGETAFRNCTALSDVIFGPNTGYLCNGIFMGCTSLAKIELPKNITYIGCECFKDCTSLSGITVLGVMEIDNNAFENCSNLYSIHLPNTLIHIAPQAFSFCRFLKSVFIKNRFVDIDETAFDNDVNIEMNAVQYSTAYHYAKQYGIDFNPIIINEKKRICSSEDIAKIVRANIPFQMKLISKTQALIRFDELQELEIKRVLGDDF